MYAVRSCTVVVVVIILSDYTSILQTLVFNFITHIIRNISNSIFISIPTVTRLRAEKTTNCWKSSSYKYAYTNDENG